MFLILRCFSANEMREISDFTPATAKPYKIGDFWGDLSACVCLHLHAIVCACMYRTLQPLNDQVQV